MKQDREGVHVPEGLDEAPIRNLAGTARELIGIARYRQGKISHGKLAKFLALARGQVDELPERHGVVDEFSAEEISKQVEASRAMRRKGP